MLIGVEEPKITKENKNSNSDKARSTAITDKSKEGCGYGDDTKRNLSGQIEDKQKQSDTISEIDSDGSQIEESKIPENQAMQYVACHDLNKNSLFQTTDATVSTSSVQAS